MRNIVLCLTYLGTAYHGWQVQKNLKSRWHGTLEAAAEAVVGHPGSYDRLRPHGRGGARPGVRGQFPHRFDHPLPTGCPMRLNTHLPPDVVVSAVPGRCHERLQRHWLLRRGKRIPT